MKKCANCGKEYPDDRSICADDGRPLEAVSLLSLAETAWPKETPYRAWLGGLKDNPLGAGVKGFALMFSTLGLTLLAMLVGLSLFPPGRYPQLLLVLPGLLVGGFYFYASGYLFFKLAKPVALVVGLVVGLSAGGLFATLVMQVARSW